MDIPWNVPQSHGTVGWDGHFTAFLDTYVILYVGIQLTKDIGFYFIFCLQTLYLIVAVKQLYKTF